MLTLRFPALLSHQEYGARCTEIRFQCVSLRSVVAFHLPHRPACAAVQSLKTGVERGADSAAGWLGLAELQYQLRQYQVPCHCTESSQVELQGAVAVSLLPDIRVDASL